MFFSQLIGGISCQELHGSAELEFQGSKVRGTRVFKCAWSDRIELCKALQGSVRNENGQIVRTNPASWPEDTNLICTSAKAGVFANNTIVTDSEYDIIAYEWARVVATYEHGYENGGSFDTVESYKESYDFTSEFLTIPTRGLQFIGGTQSIELGEETQLGLLIPGVEYSLTRFRLPVVPLANIYSLLGKTNNSTFLGAGEGQVLFLGGRASVAANSSDVPTWELELKFAIRANDWNKIFMPGQGWGSIFNPATGSDVILYPYANFFSILPR